MPKSLKTNRLWSIVLVAVLVASAVSAMNAQDSYSIALPTLSAI